VDKNCDRFHEAIARGVGAEVVAFVTTLGIGLLGCLAVFLYGQRRPVGASLSWGQAMAASVFAFFLFSWWYGVIPHQWIEWADADLGWRSDSYLIQASGSPLEGGWPLDITMVAVRDFLAILIYGVGLTLHVALWIYWQNRGKERPAKVPTSRYGRPLVRKG
jgi:hypothetical protein